MRPGARERLRVPARVRSTAFVALLALLVASIPALGYVGARTILRSRAGKVETRTNDPRAPGYLALVEPTPTALVVLRGPDGQADALTVLALGTGNAGGSVLFVPLDTNLRKSVYYVDRLRTAGLRGGQTNLVGQTARLLGIAFGTVVELDDAAWASLVAPVAPLAIDNPVAVDLGNGQQLPAGPVLLQADQVGPYLRATVSGQDDLDRLGRHRVLWQAWIKAIATSSSPSPVPNTITGIGSYIKTLAGGTPEMATLAVTPATALGPDGSPVFDIDAAAGGDQIADAVPAPQSPAVGVRYSLRLLNGVNGSPIPDAVVRRLVRGGGQVNAVGNASSFGRAVTRIAYRSASARGQALIVKALLGAGTVVSDPTGNDAVDLTVTLGKDVL